MLDRFQFRDARIKLGFSQRSLAEEWGMGYDADRTIRRWESNERPLNSIAAYAMKMMLENNDG